MPRYPIPSTISPSPMAWYPMPVRFGNNPMPGQMHIGTAPPFPFTLNPNMPWRRRRYTYLHWCHGLYFYKNPLGVTNLTNPRKQCNCQYHS